MSTYTYTEYRLIAQFRGNEEYVAQVVKGDMMSPATMKETWEWYLTERAVGEFVRIEKRTVTLETTDWQTVDIPEKGV